MIGQKYVFSLTFFPESLNEQAVSTLCRMLTVFNNPHPGNNHSTQSGSFLYEPDHINVVHSLSTHYIFFSHKVLSAVSFSPSTGFSPCHIASQWHYCAIILTLFSIKL